jgi:hypothetical protein
VISITNIQRSFGLFIVLTAGCLAVGQAPAPPVAAEHASMPAVIQPAIESAATSPCARPAEVFDIDEYDGPLNKLVARFTRKLEIKTVHAPHRKPRTPLCALNANEKLHLFMEDTFEPVNFLDAGWDAALAQAANDDPTFGQGAAGFGKRYGVALLDNVSGDFFNTFLYPSVFRQDPRYYRLGHGTFHQRLGYALRHTFVAHSDSGHLMPNYSEWFGTASAKALSNLYHPGNERGFGTVAERAGMSITTDMAWDVAREFWPEITHKLHLPFRPRQNEWATTTPAPAEPGKRPPDAAKPAPLPGNGGAVDATHQ